MAIREIAIHHTDAWDTKEDATERVTKLQPLLKTATKIGSIGSYTLSKAPWLPSTFYIFLSLDDVLQAYLVAEHQTVHVGGLTIPVLSTRSLNSIPEARGKDLPLKMYQSLLKAGNILQSDSVQSTGSVKLWIKLANSSRNVFVLENLKPRARPYPSLGFIKKPKSVIWSGDLNKLTEQVYQEDDKEATWMIVPSNSSLLSKIKAVSTAL
jgi:hypothetical protein